MRGEQISPKIRRGNIVLRYLEQSKYGTIFTKISRYGLFYVFLSSGEIYFYKYIASDLLIEIHSTQYLYTLQNTALLKYYCINDI